MSLNPRFDDGTDEDFVPHYTSTKTDDFSCDPSRWSWSKLAREKPHGMPAVVAEYEKRTQEADDHYRRQCGHRGNQ